MDGYGIIDDGGSSASQRAAADKFGLFVRQSWSIACCQNSPAEANTATAIAASSGRCRSVGC